LDAGLFFVAAQICIDQKPGFEEKAGLLRAQARRI
jgi:hypothetical protein